MFVYDGRVYGCVDDGSRQQHACPSLDHAATTHCQKLQANTKTNTNITKKLQGKYEDPNKNYNKKHALLSFEHCDANWNYTGCQAGVLYVNISLL